MTPENLIHTLKDAFKNMEQILIKGAPGIGKTQIVMQAAKEAGADLIISHPAVSDPTDYKGLPSKSADGSHADFLPFGETWKAIQAKKLTVWFLDDLGQASESVQKALMQLLLGRRLNGQRLSDDVIFCGATNDVNQRSGVSGLIEPVKSRWDSIISLDVSLDDWTKWALLNKMPVELIAFLRTKLEVLNDFQPTKELTNSPCPRTWASVGKRIARGIDAKTPGAFELFSGAVGQGAATELMAFLELAKEAPSIDAILANPETEAIPEKPSLKYLVASGLASRATKQNFSRVFKYLERMPQQFRVLSIRDAIGKDKTLAATENYISWVCGEGKEIM